MKAASAHFWIPKLYDVGAALPIIAFNAAALIGFCPKLASDVGRLSAGFDWWGLLVCIREAETIFFLGLQTVLFLVRHLPQRKLSGIMPRLVAALAGNLGYTLLFLPQVPAAKPILVGSTLLSTVGLAGCVISVAYLGRSFSIFPQSRRLITGGPYKFIRHPLYLAESITLFGTSWQFEQPWALLLFLVCFAFQFPRMTYEERVLRETYPEYEAYDKTARLIPGIY